MARLLGLKPPVGGVGHLQQLERSDDLLQHRKNPRRLNLARSSKSVFVFTSRKHDIIVSQLRPLDGVATDLASTLDTAADRRLLSSTDADLGVLRPGPSDLGVNQPSKVNLPPRICTLRAFGKSPEGVITNGYEETMSDFWKSLAANVEFKTRIQDWEILSGRLAMMVFASALLLEAVTGNSVFQKLDPHRLIEVAGAFVISSLFAAGFAVAWSAKTEAAYMMSKGYESFLNALIDNVVDGLFFDDD